MSSALTLLVSAYQEKWFRKRPMSRLYGLVLAGGKSSRMGRNKALLEWQDKPLFLAMADKLAAAGADPVLISGNSQMASQQFGKTVTDRLPNRGPLSGIHAALFDIPDNDCLLNSLLVVPVDMPLLSAESLKYLADYSSQNKTACYFQDFTLPVCLPVNTRLRETVRQAINSPDRKDYSIRRLLRHLDGRAVPLPAPEQATLFRNTNTPEEWQACQTYVRSQSAHKEYS
ncbi:molybdenum cofactor guanylyltransferase [Endozoicomonas gorgoniicola]|uniref:Molybdenum cofactor guanylyltransferase n=1 Tax=Endozoicomonas gorgoniicola TaxID=1234144 RepID=A0ABT3MRH9_9GAMM|nr:molybdenum cofactor guanylyltransferase [Endozoicomonas gorgoniicola]MCW7551974.1 molybdenum cofactor guanylyltransferase [Endozoicomonas gorgoniicola]